MVTLREGELTTRDGRRVTYAEFGDPRGQAVIACHGSAESRLFEAEPDWTSRNGFRVISPDRPGFGGSDPKVGRTLLDWADDVADLADALGLDRFAILGFSGGGPHALACAHVLGPRVAAIALVGSFAPFKLVPGAYEAMAPDLQLLADVAPGDPEGTAALVAEVASAWVDDPQSFGLGGVTVAADEAVRAHPVWGPNLEAQIAEGLRRPDGIAWDAAALYGDWGFAVGEVPHAADVWHGTSDSITPFLNGAWLAENLPSGLLHPIEAGGHLIIYSHWASILGALRGRLAAG